MEPQAWAAILGSSVIAAVATSIVNAIVQRRKTGAETTEIVTKAAGGLVEHLSQDADRVRRELDAERTARRADEVRINELEIEVDRMRARADRAQRAWERERIAWRHTLQVHAAWDILAVQSLTASEAVRNALPPLPEPPPLTPPTRASDYQDDASREKHDADRRDG